MALRSGRITMNLVKRKSILSTLQITTDIIIVPRSIPRTAIPALQRSYATVPTVTSPAHPPALQRQEPKKGVMDYVLTTADAVLTPHTPHLTQFRENADL